MQHAAKQLPENAKARFLSSCESRQFTNLVQPNATAFDLSSTFDGSIIFHKKKAQLTDVDQKNECSGMPSGPQRTRPLPSLTCCNDRTEGIMKIFSFGWHFFRHSWARPLWFSFKNHFVGAASDLCKLTAWGNSDNKTQEYTQEVSVGKIWL